MLRYLKLAERHFARTAARASLGLPPLEPPNEFLCPVTQARQPAQKNLQKEPIQPTGCAEFAQRRQLQILSRPCLPEFTGPASHPRLVVSTYRR